ncbi:MAG: transcription elongation factor GreA [Gammaproteobacteria bacterium]|nr:transcription elongation factor GreA [Gammaproteobacteria bacterium]MDH3768928.1 transcription elongation factor GreA [Gammaproteobacteria bacterium]
MSRAPLTASGAEVLRDELAKLKKEDRPKVIQAIAAAREHGDLKENAEYHAAREQQGFIEGRIKLLESVLSHAQIIDVSSLDAGNRVVFGATINLLDLESDDKVTYQIVGEVEADINQGRISITSPIARALIGREVGDETEVMAPGGSRSYEILDVRYV